MENTTIFGLALILIVIQFTAPSHEYGYGYARYFYNNKKLRGEELAEIANQDNLDYVVLGQQSYDGNDPVSKRQWYSFIENLDIYNFAVDYIEDLIQSIIQEDATPDSKNYLKILNTLNSLTEKTMCNNLTSHYNFIYYGTVVISIIEDKISAKKIATEISEKMANAHSKIATIKNIIETTNATSCFMFPIQECNRLIYNTVIQTDRETLMAEAETLLKFADFAHLFFWTYHIEFYKASKENNVFWYLMKSRSRIRPLVQAAVSTRLQAGIDVPNC